MSLGTQILKENLMCNRKSSYTYKKRVRQETKMERERVLLVLALEMSRLPWLPLCDWTESPPNKTVFFVKVV